MDARALIEQAPGEWSGRYRLWFRPDTEPDADCETRAEVTSELQGRSLLLRYTWEHEGAPQAGIAILTRTDGGGVQMGWSDTFHFGDGVMHNDAIGTDATVLGQYGPSEEPWGWRTEFAMPTPDELQMRAFNILPDGLEALATEAIWQRVR